MLFSLTQFIVVRTEVTNTLLFSPSTSFRTSTHFQSLSISQLHLQIKKMISAASDLTFYLEFTPWSASKMRKCAKQLQSEMTIRRDIYQRYSYHFLSTIVVFFYRIEGFQNRVKMRQLLFAIRITRPCPRRRRLSVGQKNHIRCISSDNRYIVYELSRSEVAKLREKAAETKKTPFFAVLYSHELMLPTYALCFKSIHL